MTLFLLRDFVYMVQVQFSLIVMPRMDTTYFTITMDAIYKYTKIPSLPNILELRCDAFVLGLILDVPVHQD